MRLCAWRAKLSFATQGWEPSVDPRSGVSPMAQRRKLRRTFFSLAAIVAPLADAHAAQGGRATQLPPAARATIVQPGLVRVPEVVKLPVDSAEHVLTRAGLLPVRVSRPRAGVLAGTVLSQRLAVGSLVKRGTIDTIEVATAPPQLPAVPPLVGLPFGMAQGRLQDSPYRVGKVGAVDTAVRSGTVVRQNPAAGFRPEQRIAVDIDTSTGFVRVPSVQDRRIADARNELARVGLRLLIREVSPTPDAAFRDTIVARHLPTAGQRVPVGFGVGVYVTTFSQVIRDSIDRARRDSIDKARRDSIDRDRRRDSIGRARRDSIDQARRDSIDRDRARRDSVDRARQDSTNRTRRDSIARADSIAKARQDSVAATTQDSIARARVRADSIARARIDSLRRVGDSIEAKRIADSANTVVPDSRFNWRWLLLAAVALAIGAGMGPLTRWIKDLINPPPKRTPPSPPTPPAPAITASVKPGKPSIAVKARDRQLIKYELEFVPVEQPDRYDVAARGPLVLREEFINGKR